MTAESLDHAYNLTQVQQRALGELAVPDDLFDGAMPQTFKLHELDMLDDNQGTRREALMSSLIKEKFQSIDAKLTADERDSARAAAREASVRFMFKTLGLITPSDESTSVFNAAYKSAEELMPTIDKNYIVELLDSHDDHPAMHTLDTLSNISSIPKEDIVNMRRISLVLIDQYGA